MSVSAGDGVAGGGATSDLNAVLGTSKEFAERIADLKTARETLDKAQADLNLGRSAADALQQAQVVKIAAERERSAAFEALQKEMQRVRDDVAAQAAAAKADIQTKYDAVNAAMADARIKHTEAKDALAAANIALTDAQGRAAQQLADADKAAKAAVADAEAKARKLLDDADKQSKAARADQEAATAARAEYEAKVAKLKEVLG